MHMAYALAALKSGKHVFCDRAGDATFVTSENHNVNVQNGMSLFRMPGNGSYALQGKCAAVNAGLLLGWMETSRDLVGNPRVSGHVPDLGCCEALSNGFHIRLR